MSAHEPQASCDSSNHTSPCPPVIPWLSARGRRLVTSALILLLPLPLLAPNWWMGGVGALADDLIYYLPVRQFIGERIRAGEFPLWNPLTAMGTPVAADPQSGLWYPATYLFAILPPLAAYSASLYLHYVLAGWGMYRWLRSLDREWRAALLGAVAFEFCGYLIAHRQHLTIQHAVAWVPWIFLGWQRFAATGSGRSFALAAGALGLQLLVQHLQPSIITGILLTGYVGIVLLPCRRSLLWAYPAGMLLGGAIGAVQIIPTFFHYAASGRGTPPYSLFIENSYVLSSLLLMLFPMFFGTPAQTLWADKWWGVSHLIEQWAYGTILMLVLAIASVPLIRSAPVVDSPDRNPSLRRQTLFWWGASFLAFIIAVGDLTPVSKLLFHIPIYRSLRVPARWTLVWSIAIPVLASAVLTVVIRGGPLAGCLARRLRRIAVGLPVAAIALLLLTLLLGWQVHRVERWTASPYLRPLLQAMLTTVRPWNPAILWPLALMAATAFLLVRWSRTQCPRLFGLLCVTFLVDLASVVPFIDVDLHTYTRRDFQSSPPLATVIHAQGPRPGERLLVPRLTASYVRPLEVLWPQTNMFFGVSTFHSYGPLWPAANRLVFRFMPWGASEDMLELLRNPRLLRAMGIRFLAARSPEEQTLINIANWPADPDPQAHPARNAAEVKPVEWEYGVLWPVDLEGPGLYELAFDAEPVPGSPSRWFVRVERSANEPLSDTRTMEPVDLPFPRRMRFLFRVEETGRAFVRVKSEMGQAFRAGRATFGRIALPPDDDHPPDVRFQPVGELPDGVRLYEVASAYPLVYWAAAVERVDDIASAVHLLRDAPPATEHAPTLVEASARTLLPVSSSTGGEIHWSRPVAHQMKLNVHSDRGGVLVVNETYNQGWRADIDGIEARLFRTNAVCMGMAVPPGRHEIRLRYQPRGLTSGILITSGGALLLLGAVTVRAQRRTGR